MGRAQSRHKANAQEQIGRALDEIRATCDLEARRASDPVEFVHRYSNPLEQELVALIASSLAFGNVKALRAKIADALSRLGPDLLVTAEDPKRLRALLRGWKHRVYQDAELVCLIAGARQMQLAHGSLGKYFERAFKAQGSLHAALVEFTSELRKRGKLDALATLGARHILTDPSKGSASKRLLLFLRWMVRESDGIDLGLWKIPRSALVIPVDTHIHKLGRNLGFTERNNVSWKTAEEITAALRAFDADDPVKYDFALCHLGMLQDCPSKRDEKRCAGCGIRTVCRHWR